MKLIKLIPGENDKYHFGEGDLTDSSIIFHSHSLYSAIINNLIKLYGDMVIEKDNNNKKIGLLKSLKEDIILSSVFPAIYKVENGKINDFIYFLPKPATKLGFDNETQKKVEEKPKEIKKVQFISVKALEKHNSKKLKKYIVGKKFLVDKDEYITLENYGNPEEMKLFEEVIEQKVSIDRIKQITLEEGKGQLYSIGYVKPCIYYPKNNNNKDEGNNIKNEYLIVGYYFLLDFNGDNDLLKKIESAIRLIKDEGLGGERSNGAGLFREIIIEDEIPNDFKKLFDNDKKDKINARMTLSITIPEKDTDEFGKITSYQLMSIRGYIYSSSNYSSLTKAKKYIYAIKEGAIVEEEIKGKIENIAPDNYNHEVLVNGKPILIPINIMGDNNGN